MTARGFDRKRDSNLPFLITSVACVNRTAREGTDGQQPNELPQYPDARFGGDGVALHLWPQHHRRVGAVIGRLHHVRPCSWRRWRSGWRRLPWWWWFPRRRLSRRRIRVWLGSGPGRPLWAVWLRRLSLRRILSLLWRRGRLLCGSATRLDSLWLASTPRFGLRVMAAVRRSA